MGRVLALDFGTRRVGAAISDPRRMIASPLEVYQRTDRDRDARHYQALVNEQDVDLIVIGLPLHTSGRESESSNAARSWGGWLAETTGRPVVFFDERYSSAEAEELLRAAGVRAARRASKRDMLAAQVLLRSFLDAGCPMTEAPARPLDDASPDEESPT